MEVFCQNIQVLFRYINNRLKIVIVYLRVLIDPSFYDIFHTPQHHVLYLQEPPLHHALNTHTHTHLNNVLKY